jgi:type III secretion protein L
MAIGKVIKGDAAAEAVVSSERPPLARPTRAGVMNAEIFEARQSAQGILEEAHKEKDRILAEAQREREEVLAKAREQGRQEGLAQSSEVLLRAKMQAGEMLANNEKDVIALACKIAEKIIGRDIERQPELILDMCATAIEQIRSARAMVLRVHPKTAQVLRSRKPELMELIGRAVDLAIREDPDVSSVGAQLPTQFEMLQNVLLPDPNKKKEGPA